MEPEVFKTMTAQDAREYQRTSAERKVKKHLTLIYKLIKKHIEEGEEYIETGFGVSPEAIETLKKDGFTVQENGTTKTIKISW